MGLWDVVKGGLIGGSVGGVLGAGVGAAGMPGRAAQNIRDTFVGPPMPEREAAPPRVYAELDAGSRGVLEKQIAGSNIDPSQIAAEQNAYLNQPNDLLSNPQTMAEQDLALGRFGDDAVNRAIASRASKVYSRDVGKIKQAHELGAFDEAQNRARTAAGALRQSEEIKFGMAERARETAMMLDARQRQYDADRSAARSQAISNVLGLAGMGAGFALGGGLSGAQAGRSIGRGAAGGR